MDSRVCIIDILLYPCQWYTKGFFPARGFFVKEIHSPHFILWVWVWVSPMVEAAGIANLIDGFKPAPYGPMITYLQFADDNLIFGDAKEDQIKNIKAILRCKQF